MAGNDLEALLGGLLGAGRGGPAHLMGSLLSALGAGSGSGGNALDRLMEQLRDGGLGDQADSWVSTGANDPISGPELAQGLPYQVLEYVAEEAGISPETAADQLAEVLPEAVDKLTPDGTVPQGSLEDALTERHGG
ncbi:YidB family protein [Streptomyces sp. XD-27]|uniref:YidB family protein n=1 Tax=Streptomyces sp. XD-27 TaxID=3062779 RepID=UPI0026F4494A|nr:YidB family protein [Streptomyces sp. XD-27]WKX68934.1 YidB family protein [Streptomyces sp. XD-27]